MYTEHMDEKDRVKFDRELVGDIDLPAASTAARVAQRQAQQAGSAGTTGLMAAFRLTPG